jgi:KDO2-lipid IV(A) lauroyltransferase
VRAGLRGTVELLRWTRVARLARANLELALGGELAPQQRAEVLRGMRAHTARIVHEWLFLARAGNSEREARRVGEWIDAHVVFDESAARLDEIIERGQGVLVATAHIGNWELLAARLRRRGLDGAVVGLRKRNDSSADWLVRMRSGYGVRTLAQDDSPRESLRILREGGTLGVLCDLEVKRLAGEFVPFFGVDALTITAPAALARAARLPLLPMRCVWRAGRYVISIGEPLALDATLERRAAARELLTRLNTVFESWIRETPEQWCWHQPRWSARPAASAAHLVPLAARRKRARS